MTKTEITDKVGTKFFLANEYSLDAILEYESGIPSFDKYLNGKSLKQIGSVIHLIKYPKGFVIKIAKLFSSFPFGISFSEIKRISIIEKSVDSKLIFETSSNGKIIFSFNTRETYDVKQFLEEIHISYDNGESKSNEKHQQKGKSYKSYSKNEQEEKGYKQHYKRQYNNDRNNTGMSKGKAFEILEIKPNVTKAEIKKSYRNLVKKYNTDQRATYEEHVIQMLDDKMKEINTAKDFLRNNGYL